MSSITVIADGGPDHLIFKQIRVEVPVDALENAAAFRQEVRTLSHHALTL